jgi:hypothetical protein
VLEQAKAKAAAQGGKVAMIYLESPGNPTNALVDIEAVRDARDASWPTAPPRSRSTTPSSARCGSGRSTTAPTSSSIR